MELLNKIDYYLSKQSKAQLAKGQRIVNANEINISEDEVDGFLIDVPSESSDEVYMVEIELDSFDELFAGCECAAYEEYGDCKHCVAAALSLKDYLTDQANEPAKIKLTPQLALPIDIEDGYFRFTMVNIDMYALKKLAGFPDNKLLNKIINNTKPGNLTLPHQYFGYYEKSKKVCEIEIIYDGGTGFKTKCTCGDKTQPICVHVLSSFTYLQYNFGTHYFSRFKDFTTEKNKMLAPYGLAVTDPEAKDFEWAVTHWGELTLTKKPAWLIAAGSTTFLEGFKKSIIGNSETQYTMLRPKLAGNVMVDYEIGFLFNFTSRKHIGFEFEPVFVRDKKGKTDVKKLSLHNQGNLPYLQSLSDDFFYRLLEFGDKNLTEWTVQHINVYLKNYSVPWTHMSASEDAKLKQHYLELLQNLWPLLLQEPYIFGLYDGSFSNANIVPVKLSAVPARLTFAANTDGRLISIKSDFKTGADDAGGYTLKGGILMEKKGTLYLPQNTADLSVMEKFKAGVLKFPVLDQLEVIKNVLVPLQGKYEVTIDESFNFEISAPEPVPHLLLSEFEDKFLMLKPRFEYGDTLIEYDDSNEFVQHTDGKYKIINRNKPEEKKLYEYLRGLHPKFAAQRNNLYYFLPFAEVMKANWFLNMIAQVQEAGYPVYGLQDLKTFRYNTNTPTFDIKAGSGIDWFDLQIEISWGDQQVSLKDIRKAILNKQEAILLDDGSLGMIPAEWLDQYGLLLKLGNEKDGKLQVSKLHNTLLEELGSKLNNKDIEKEIAEKKKKLLNFTEIPTHHLPSAAINAQLRPYQLAGFHWLQALHDLGWGGCLADDMGLGKTLQTITFLQFLKEKGDNSTQLIICPTSLIFNWESELDKFCPALKYHTYYGNMRSFDDNHFEQFDIILTTYGVVRMDIEHLSGFNWDYVILDESQAIKNPDAQVTKSLQLLNAKNRLILSGTPVQNNTYDLYAQFNFINPGFLGNREFFKREFAGPIDKYGDKLKSEQLRKMIYPFLLRRTKEQVATDLPDKTEMILWCSMNKAQRSMYDEYKNFYRNMLLKKIDEEGMGNSSIYVLEGLLRLRQICDHPALIKADTEAPDESVKTSELMREIQENSGGHKLLVFSQFTEMLHIIRKELEKEGVKYCYLDGSTPGEKRRDEVKRFQEDESVKVFLISLKAGGVGLNLTAADYVYIVDPWWNPAAEQQAIDRTHRIGQTRKIFAYKMICKDTVEEKILQLQQKKKSLADDLISEDSGFVKKLTKDDIAFLFS